MKLSGVKPTLYIILKTVFSYLHIVLSFIEVRQYVKFQLIASEKKSELTNKMATLGLYHECPSTSRQKTAYKTVFIPTNRKRGPT